MSTSKRLLATLFVSQSLISAGFIAIITLHSIVAVELSGSDSNAGIPTTIITFTSALVAFPMGIIMGRFGRRIGISLGYSFSFLGAIIGFIAVTQGSFPLLLISSAMLGAGRTGSEQSRYAAGEVFPESQRARMIGWVIFAGTIGAIGGPLLIVPGGQIAESMSFHVDSGPWLMAIGLFLMAIIVVFTLLRPDPLTYGLRFMQSEDKPKVDQKIKPARPLREIFQSPQIRLAVLAMVLSQTIMTVLMVITPLHMKHNDYGNASVGLVIAAHTLGMFGLSGLTGYLIDRLGRTYMLVIGALILITAAILAPLSTSMPILIISLFLLGLGWNFGFIAGSSMLADALKGDERGRVQGISDMMVAFGSGVGSLSSGPLFAAGGFFAVCIIGFILTIILMLFIGRLSQAQPRQALA